MSSGDNWQVLVLGQGPVARALANSFSGLGFHAYESTPDQGIPEHLNPAITVVCDECGSAVEALEQIESKTGTTLVPTLEACRITRNREGIRRTAAEELGLPTMAYEFAETPEELRRCVDALGYPCVVKPPTSAGGRGHTVVRVPEDVVGAFRRARETNPDGAVAVERYVDFDFEVTILTARSVDPATGQLATWFCEPIGTRHEDGRLVEAWQPVPLTEAAMDNARSIAARITGKIGAQGLYSIELFVAGDEVYFSQVNPRPSSDGMLTSATQRVDQFELHARAVVGLPIDVTLVTPGAARFVPNATADLNSLARALAVEETGLQVLGNDEDTIIVRSTGESVEQARSRAEQAVAALRAERA